jgi:phosphatidylglycerol:prolipoprotein diacylglycerol transferase
MFPLFQIGSVAIQVPGLILLLALWIGLNIAEKEAKRRNQPPEEVYGLIMIALLGGIIGGRLWYVVRYLDAFVDDPLGIISLNTNTVDTVAVVIIGLALAVIYGRRKNLQLRPTLDILTPGLAFFAIGLALSHLSSGNAFGMPTKLPWAIELWSAERHPTQIYEMLLATIIFVVVLFIRKEELYSGILFLTWLALTAASRLFLEAFRGDSAIVAGGIREAQLVALTILLLAIWLIGQWSKEKTHIAL